MRRLTMVGIVAAAWLAVTALPTLGEDNGIVNATVATPSPCMTLDVTVADFGTHPFGIDNSIASEEYVKVFDCSGAEQTVYIQGSDALSIQDTIWSLQTSDPCLAGPNTFRLAAHNETSSIAGSSQADIKFSLVMPCQGSDGQGETMAFDISFLVTIP